MDVSVSTRNIRSFNFIILRNSKVRMRQLASRIHDIVPLTNRPLKYLDFDSQKVQLGRSEGISLSPPLNYRMISSWIKDCDKNHKCLRWAADPARMFLPSRLLLVGNEDEETIKLVLTRGARIKDGYATLSYCWGTSGVPIKLLSHLVSNFQLGIPLASLPKTLREFIRVLRHMRVKYTWIDSLCITQDSTNDWEHESKLMGDVYSNAYCNLAATNSQDCDGGLSTAGPAHTVPRQRPIVTGSSWEGVGHHQLNLNDHGVFSKSVDEAPLNKRGWVLQERLLSPRTIHFGEQQLFWECFTATAGETYPELYCLPFQQQIPKLRLSFHPNIPRWRFLTWALSRPPQKRFKPRSYQPLIARNPKGSRIAYYPYYYWMTLVSAYAITSLTKKQDRMVAISGVARMIHNLTSDEYIAGLWHSRFAWDLLWYMERPALPVDEEYLGPSWSWVSSVSGIKMGHSNLETDSLSGRRLKGSVSIKLLSFDVKHVTEDKFGEIRSGVVHVSGRLYPGQLQRQPESQHDWAIHIEELLDGTSHSAKLDREPLIDHGNPVYVVPVAVGTCFNGQEEVDALILQPTGASKGEYRRIGLVLIWADKKTDILANLSKPYEFDPNLFNESGNITLV